MTCCAKSHKATRERRWESRSHVLESTHGGKRAEEGPAQRPGGTGCTVSSQVLGHSRQRQPGAQVWEPAASPGIS